MTWDDWTAGQALWGPEDSDPRFGDATIPCLQLVGQQAVLTDDATMSITTYQDDAFYGLRSFPEARFDERTWEGIYRWRALTELPVGEVEEVAVFVDEGLLAEVDLRIGGHPLLLVAGELDGTPEDELLLHRLNDSVLAFTDLGAAENAPWTSSRRDLRPIPIS